MSKISSTPSSTTLTPAQLAVEQQEALAGTKPGGVNKAHGGGHAHKAGGGGDASESTTTSLSASSNTLDGYPTNPFGE